MSSADHSAATSAAISAEEYTKSRTVAFSEGIKHLLLANGGGVAALLAFLQAVWDPEPELARSVLVAIAFLAAGVGFLLPVQFIRIRASHADEKSFKKGVKTTTGKLLWRVYNGLPFVSIACFVSGVGYLVYKGLQISA